MALSEGLKGFVNFFTKSFNEGNEDDAFMDLVDRDGDYDTDGTLALDTMYGTRVNNKPERSFERESKVVSHPNSYKSGEVTVIEPRSFSESAQIVKKLIDKKTVILHLDLLDKEQSILFVVLLTLLMVLLKKLAIWYSFSLQAMFHCLLKMVLCKANFQKLCGINHFRKSLKLPNVKYEKF